MMAAVGSFRTARLGAVFAILILAALPGCASIRVDRTQHSGPFAAWRASVLRREELSPRTLQTLRQWDLANLYARTGAVELSRRYLEEALASARTRHERQLIALQVERARDAYAGGSKTG